MTINANETITDIEPVMDDENQKINMAADIHDSPEDEAKMQSESVILDLPEVSDIPGQENIVVPHMQEMADTTISSADEEGEGLFDDDETDDETGMVEGNDADVTAAEKAALETAAHDMPTEDDITLREAALDATDEDGDPLNENDGVTAGDLDVSGADEDDDMEDIGAEDEENNDYSLGSDGDDELTDGKS